MKRSAWFLFISLCVFLPATYAQTRALHQKQSGKAKITKTQPVQKSTSQEKRLVIINIRHDAPLAGRFIKADSHSVLIETTDAHSVMINLEDITSIDFLDLGSTTKKPLTGRAKDAANSALKTLRVLAAAVEVGINNRDYSTRLIDAKSAIEDILTILPDSDLKFEIKAALLDYEYAASTWNFLNSRTGQYISDLIGPEEPFMQKLLKDYPNITTIQYDNRPFYDRRTVLSGIWNAATKHTENASILLNQS